jgi:uncharacterized protein YuzE
MQFTFDQDSGVYYVQLSSGKVVDSEVNKNLVIDYGKDGNIIGIEILPFDVQNKIEERNISDFIVA